VRGVVMLTEHPLANGGVFNIGGTREISITELADLIRSTAVSASEMHHIPYEDAYGPGFEDMARRVPDTSRINNLVGWSPEISLEQTLREVLVALRSGAASKSPAVEVAPVCLQS
jgi:UDP-glucose 4-epimerase